MVGIEGGSGLPSDVLSTLVTTPVRLGSRPVSSADLAGEHCGVLQKAERKVTPVDCSHCRLGRFAGPGNRADSWSDMTTNTLGRFPAASSAPVAVPTNV